MVKKRLSEQVKAHIENTPAVEGEYAGNDKVISTGSTLLDLAISGGRFPAGGIPGGIMVEVFGPSGAGKTVLLCEIAGNIQRQGGEVMFRDPEARLNKQFAKLFDLNVENIAYDTPNTVLEVFKSVREWEPKSKGINGIFADSLAALTTEWEQDGKDTYGMRRAKEFSEQCRLTCRVLAEKGFLMVCSNQVRQNVDAGLYEQKYISTGGMAIGFYSSLRLRCSSPSKIKIKRKIDKKEIEKIVGVETNIEIVKSSVWKPYRTATLYILFDYGIDDIRANLQYVKDMKGETVYTVDGQELDRSMEKSIQIVEKDNLEGVLKQEVIRIWNQIEEKFVFERKGKVRGG